MKSRSIRWSAIVLVLLIAAIHLFMAPSENEESPILGYLFVANFFGGLAAAVGIRRSEGWGWVLGFWVAAGSIAGYIVTRSLGLPGVGAMPGMEPEEWLYPIGVMSVVLELAFVTLFVAARPWQQTGGNPLRELAVLGAAVGFVAAFGLTGVVWNLLGTTDQHGPSLAHVRAISEADLAEKYGLQVLQVAPSMMNSIVDYRLRILDAKKAEPLLGGHGGVAALVVDGDTLLLAPTPHSHKARLKDGGMLFAFFPNRGLAVKSGATVSALIGDLRLPEVVVR